MKLIRVQGNELKLRLSPTFIQNAACPAYLNFRYILKVKDQYTRIAAERGKASHGAIAELIEYARTNEVAIKDISEELLRDVINKHLPHTIVSELGLVYTWVKLWRDRFELPSDLHGVEDRIALDDEYNESNWDDASYRGILDLSQINGAHGTLTDWKSQPNIVAQSELDMVVGSDIAEQMTMYAWLAWKHYPFLKTFTIRIWYLRYGFYAETSRTVDQLAEFENILMIKEQKISEISDWEPIPGRHCQYCDYIHRCSIAQNLSPDNSEVITQEQAVLAAQRVTVYEALTKDLKAKLKIYVNANDEVRIGDNWYAGYHKKTGVSYNVAKVDESLAKQNRRLSEVASIDAKKMKKLLKQAAYESPDLESDIEDAQKPTHKTEFKMYRRGDDAVDSEDGES